VRRPRRRAGLARGFAVVSTDRGHQGAVFDASFMRDEEAAMNFAMALGGRRVIAVAPKLAARGGN